MQFVFCGLSITSSWGNGHAVTYRGLIRELAARGHEILFLERDVYWYADNRDLPDPSYCKIGLYKTLEELKDNYTRAVRQADVVVIGSYVPDGVAVAAWATNIARGTKVFYDIDTPVTMAKLARGDEEYIAAPQIQLFDLYLSFTGGPLLRTIERRYASPCARVLYCSADPALYFPEPTQQRWDMGYLGTYGADRQPALTHLLLDPARSLPDSRFVVAGPLYPPEIQWPDNVDRIDHLPPTEHRRFYNGQRFTLNVTRADMVRSGYSPSVRLFEAAACATPIISDHWQGLGEVFRIGKEILVARNAGESIDLLKNLREDERRKIGERARKKFLSRHTPAHRAAEFEAHVYELANKASVATRRLAPAWGNQL